MRKVEHRGIKREDRVSWTGIPRRHGHSYIFCLRPEVTMSSVRSRDVVLTRAKRGFSANASAPGCREISASGSTVWVVTDLIVWSTAVGRTLCKAAIRTLVKGTNVGLLRLCCRPTLLNVWLCCGGRSRDHPLCRTEPRLRAPLPGTQPYGAGQREQTCLHSEYAELFKSRL